MDQQTQDHRQRQGFRFAGPSAYPLPSGHDGSVDAYAREAGLRLVSGGLVLGALSDSGKAEHDRAWQRLAAWLGIAIAWRLQGKPQGLRDAARRAMAGAVGSTPPRFAPEQCVSALAFQDPRALRGLPRARWVAGYLHDIGAGPGPGARDLDVLVMSPHPDACRIDEDCAAVLPGVAVVKEMIAAAQVEGRGRLAVIVPDRCRGAAARLLLAAVPAAARGEMDFDVLSVEEAVVRLAKGAPAWDAILVLPEQRGMIVALLAAQHAIRGPWPMVWHDRGQVLVCGEMADGPASGAAFDAGLFVQSLALAVQLAGNPAAARRLHQGWARLRDRGVMTARRGADAPYARQVDDAEMIDLICADALAASDRQLPQWKALAPASADHPAPSQPRLRLVAAG